MVVYSDHLHGQKEKTFDRNLQKEKDRLKKEFKKLEATAYHCEKDGRKAISTFKAKHSSPYLTYEVELRPEETTEKRPKRGRPKKDETANTVTVFRPCLAFLEEDAEAVRKEKQRLGTFILITDLVSADKRPDIEILRNYKGQEAAETRFRILKSPQMVDAFFLKKPSRIEALGIVFVMALLVYGILENRVRENMKKEEEPLVLASRRKVDQPTAQVLLKELKNIRLIYIEQNGSVTRFIPDNLSERASGFWSLRDTTS
ncbi:IS1634 family transposase [Bacillus sp. V33-4]|uniref:IS1634 family transposase n=1 Tax=Bacillus sp. V33-4 TaxID=2054169 RepID=UPI00215513FB|nr:IS1634 family transposase [Bacillus sp. V33-4]